MAANNSSNQETSFSSGAYWLFAVVVALCAGSLVRYMLNHSTAPVYAADGTVANANTSSTEKTPGPLRTHPETMKDAPSEGDQSGQTPQHQ